MGMTTNDILIYLNELMDEDRHSIQALILSDTNVNQALEEAMRHTIVLGPNRELSVLGLINSLLADNNEPQIWYVHDQSGKASFRLAEGDTNDNN